MRIRAACVLVLLPVACASPRPGELSRAETEAIVAEVREVLQEAYDLSKPRLSDRMMALYPITGPVFSASGGRVQSSRDSLERGVRYFWDNVGVNMREARWVWDTTHVTVLSHDAAAVTATYHIPHRNPNNEEHVLGGAMTAVFKKQNGRWVIVQEHLSDLPQNGAPPSQ